MIKCFHARRNFDTDELEVPLIATIYSDNESLEAIWDCCNNSCWYGENWENMEDYNRYSTSFKVKFTPDYWGYCNDDLIIEMNNKFTVALSLGWKEFNTFESAFEWCKNNSRGCV